MIATLDLKVLPAQAFDPTWIEAQVRRQLHIPQHKAIYLQLQKRSIDARSRQPVYQLRYAVFEDEEPQAEPLLSAQFREVQEARACLIVGAGPAGYFAALRMLELGIKPIILERGKDVQARRRDLRAIQQEGIVNPDSNYCFGEGGAGTYSDGKLYTRSTKRGDVHRVLRLLVEHGANPDILVDAHPHIGTNKLPQLVANLRETIRHYGGEVHFDSRVSDLILRDGQVRGLHLADGRSLEAEAIILATGHSARDIFEMLHAHGLSLEAKPFALGVRIEHPQEIIDRVQYKQHPRDPHLPASSYSLTCQVEQRGVFSFCMCPGGLVVPAATAPGEIVVNGMSPSRRDSPYANSGMVVAIDLEDLEAYREHGVFAALAFQREVEQTMFAAGDGSQKAPALRLTDFVEGKMSGGLPESSYIPGLLPAPLYELLPRAVYQRLRLGIQEFSRRMKAYYTAEANVIGTESRTSSPVKVPRDPQSLMHPDARGLFPCGEGAGYAGGIVSAAIDGDNVAQAVFRYFQPA